MDLIILNSDDGSINLIDLIILAAETSHKDHFHFEEAMTADNCEDFMKLIGNKIKYLNREDVWEIISKSVLPNLAQIIRLLWSFKRKRSSF